MATPQRHDLGYDNADQLLTAPLKNASTNALVRQYTYAYDLASNRTSEQVVNKTTTSTPNNINEIVSQSGGTTRTLTYDLNGSLINDGLTRTFEWDGANRLVAINYTGTTNRSEFTYDGLSRCVKIVEKTGGTVNSTRKFVWCGAEKCEFRNANNAVQLQIFPQGQYQGSGAYYYTRDHLGSIRELVDGSGTVVARYDYDPYGRSTTVIGTNKPDFNFTGLYQHAKSGLDMAVHRFYDPDLGRWLSRDPIGEAGGINLYGYVGNNPVNYVDELGLAVGDWWDFPANYRRAREIGLDELAKHDGHNDCDDATRHAEWSQRMAEELGSGYAWLFGVGHEIGDELRLEPQPIGELFMDLHNNAVGRSAAGGTIDSGQLQTVPGRGPIPFHPY